MLNESDGLHCTGCIYLINIDGKICPISSVFNRKCFPLDGWVRKVIYQQLKYRLFLSGVIRWEVAHMPRRSCVWVTWENNISRTLYPQGQII